LHFLFDDDAPAEGFLQAASEMGSIPQRESNCGLRCCRELIDGLCDIGKERQRSTGNRLKLNGCSEFSSSSSGTLRRRRSLMLTESEEDHMRKSAYVIAALAAITVAAPSIASADTVVIKHRDNYWRGAHAEFREHRDFGWHRGWWHRDHDRDRDRVIIREHRSRFDRDRY
jgi:hypothetical protein